MNLLSGRNPLRVMAVRDLDDDSLKLSSSGGGFALIARAILARGGIVYGAAYNEVGVSPVVHIRINSVDGLRLLQGSKYVQSDMGETFRHCLDDLRLGREVLFSGTPCQVAGLRSYIAMNSLNRESLSRLWCVDLICHGVPSPKLFQMYMDWLARRHHAKDGIHDFTFRDKRSGWFTYYSYSYSSTRFPGKTQYVHGAAWDDPFYAAYLAGELFRKCCYRCPFAQPRRLGDITVGDFWGVETACPEMFSEKGVSVMMLNTERAIEFFETELHDQCQWRETTFERAAAKNGNLTRPSRADAAQLARRERIYQAVSLNDSSALFNKLLKKHWTMKSLARRILPPSSYRWLKIHFRGIKKMKRM